MATRIAMLTAKIENCDPNWLNVTSQMIAQGRIAADDVDQVAEQDVTAWASIWPEHADLLPTASEVAEVLRAMVEDLASVNLTSERITDLERFDAISHIRADVDAGEGVSDFDLRTILAALADDYADDEPPAPLPTFAELRALVDHYCDVAAANA